MADKSAPTEGWVRVLMSRDRLMMEMSEVHS